MLRITVDLLPFGSEDDQKVLSQFVIFNTLQKSGENYIYKISKGLATPATTFQHNRDDGLLTCVRKGIAAAEAHGLDKTLIL